MLRRIGLILAVLMVFGLSARAQEGVNLPADLYVLLNDGTIQRYGIGASGVTTLTPSGLFIVDFGVDSTGGRIAFRTESGLFVIDVAHGGQPQQIDGASADVPPLRGMGDTIAWSPNGDAIAYATQTGIRVTFDTGSGSTFTDLAQSTIRNLSWSPGGSFLAAEADANVWWIYRRSGTAMTLTSAIPSSIGTTWISDSELVFAPAEGGLRIMNLDQANAQAVLLDESVTYRLPFLDKNDALVFFGRDPNDTSVPDGYGRLLRLARGAQKLETIGQVPIALGGLRWAPGGTLLVAFQGGVIALYDPSTGLGFPLPLENVVAYAWGSVNGTPASAALPSEAAPPTATATSAPPTPSQPTQVPTSQAASTVSALNLSADSFFLAPARNGVVQVWRTHAASAIPPQPFTGSGSDVSEFAAAPDGNAVAYLVDAELWLQIVGQRPQLVARINSFAPVEAAFSADGKQLAYVDQRSGVWLVALADMSPQLIRANGDKTYHRPQFSPDGSHLLLDVYSSDGVGIGVLDLATHDIAESLPMSDSRPTNTHWLRSGQIYTFVDASAPAQVDAGFYILNPASLGNQPTQWIPLPAGATVRAVVEAVPGTLRVLLADGTQDFAPVRVVDFDLTGGGQKPVLDLGAVIAPSVSPDGRFVGGYESLTEIDGIQQGAVTVIDLMTGRRYVLSYPPSAWGFRWVRPQGS